MGQTVHKEHAGAGGGKGARWACGARGCRISRSLGNALVPPMLEQTVDNTVTLGDKLGHALGTISRGQAEHAKYAVHTGQAVHAGHEVN